MAKQVMILEIGQPQGGFQTIRYAMWFPVPVGKELPTPNFASAWKDMPAKDATLLAQVQAGQMIEQVASEQFPTTLTNAQIQVWLQAAWTARNTYLNSVNWPGQFYGFYWDGAAWQAA